jgi:hypothetical protein
VTPGDGTPPFNSDNKHMQALTTTADNALATNTPILHTPGGDGYVEVAINGVSVHLGDGLKTRDCYFSADGGVHARAIADITAGDKLYWNGSVAGFELVNTDHIDLFYIAN